MTQERAARRFHQVASIERELAIKAGEIVDCKAHLKELREEHEGLILRLRAAARDQGELPLFPEEEAPATALDTQIERLEVVGALGPTRRRRKGGGDE